MQIWGGGFVSKPFCHLSDNCRNSLHLNFIIQEAENEKKYSLSLGDSYVINQELYDWCDVYGSVNANFSHYPQEKYPKLVSLCPSFGVRAFSLPEAIYYAVYNLILSPKCVLNKKRWNKYSQEEECNKTKNIRNHFGLYIKNYLHRCPYEIYGQEIKSEEGYIFFQSTLWYNDQCNQNDAGVNLRRAYFIRAASKFPNVVFEGGLLGDDSSSNELFKDVLTMQRIPFNEWITKTKRSMLVFNTPAFWDCHGWKLGEYLAMGKCIISTPLSNDLPAPLIHGKHIHYVENTEESIYEAIKYIVEHPEYRKGLEEGARTYWENYGSPQASLKLLGIDKYL